MIAGSFKQFIQARRTTLVYLLLGCATLAVYWQVSGFDFTNYDEFLMILRNPIVSAGLTLRGLGWALTTSWFDFWRPLTWLSHMLDCELFGLSAGGHHLVSLGFHVTNTLLVFGVLRRMTGAWRRSAIVAALFALHPLHVESVAWVAERKDVLSGFFFLLTVWTYVEYVTSVKCQVSRGKGPEGGSAGGRGARTFPGLRSYALAVLFFACGLMSKPMLVTTPFVLLLLDYWPLERWSGAWGEGRGEEGELGRAATARQRGGTWSGRGGQTTNHGLLSLVLEKLPFFGLSLASCLITYSGMKGGHNVLSSEAVPWGLRFVNVPVSYARYLLKTVWPTDLFPVYPLPSHWSIWQAGGAVTLLLLITVVVALGRRRAPYLLFGWLMFLGTLLPVVGIVAMSYQSIADRYTYLPSIGLFVAVVWGVADLSAGWRFRGPVIGGVTALALLLCGYLSSVQIGYWRNSFTLWTHCLAIDPDNVMAHYNYGCALQESGKMREAMEQFRTTVGLSPEAADANLNLGAALILANRTQEATNYIAKALQLKPGWAKAHANMGLALCELGDYAGAITHCAEAIRLDPNVEGSYVDMARALSGQGKSEEALRYYAEGVRRDPGVALTHYYMALDWMKQGMYGQAVSSLKEALRLAPGMPEAQAQLARAVNCRETADAIGRCRETLQRDPDSSETLNNLAWILATTPEAELRNGTEAVRLAEQACERSGWKETIFVGTLAAAYAEVGQFEKAVATTQRACELARSLGQTNLLERNQQLLLHYRDQKPWRE